MSAISSELPGAAPRGPRSDHADSSTTASSPHRLSAESLSTPDRRQMGDQSNTNRNQVKPLSSRTAERPPPDRWVGCRLARSRAGRLSGKCRSAWFVGVGRIADMSVHACRLGGPSMLEAGDFGVSVSGTDQSRLFPRRWVGLYAGERQLAVEVVHASTAWISVGWPQVRCRRRRRFLVHPRTRGTHRE